MGWIELATLERFPLFFFLCNLKAKAYEVLASSSSISQLSTKGHSMHPPCDEMVLQQLRNGPAFSLYTSDLTSTAEESFVYLFSLVGPSSRGGRSPSLVCPPYQQCNSPLHGIGTISLETFRLHTYKCC